MKVRIVAAGVVIAMFVACSPDPCGNGPTHPVGLDISGASNSSCTLVVSDGNSSLTFEIPAPSPVVADTSLGARSAPTFCEASSDAGVFAGGTRTSTQLSAISVSGLCSATAKLTVEV